MPDTKKKVRPGRTDPDQVAANKAALTRASRRAKPDRPRTAAKVAPAAPAAVAITTPEPEERTVNDIFGGSSDD